MTLRRRIAMIAVLAAVVLVLVVVSSPGLLPGRSGKALVLGGNVDIRQVDLGFRVAGRIAAISGDLAPKFEVDRARNMLADLQQQAVLARQQWRVSSARLTRMRSPSRIR